MKSFTLLAPGVEEFSRQKTHYHGLPKPIKWRDYGNPEDNSCYVKTTFCLGKTEGKFEIALRQIVSYEPHFGLYISVKKGKATLNVGRKEEAIDPKRRLTEDEIQNGKLKTFKDSAKVHFIYIREDGPKPVGPEATPAPKAVLPKTGHPQDLVGFRQSIKKRAVKK